MPSLPGAQQEPSLIVMPIEMVTDIFVPSVKVTGALSMARHSRSAAAAASA